MGPNSVSSLLFDASTLGRCPFLSRRERFGVEFLDIPHTVCEGHRREIDVIPDMGISRDVEVPILEVGPEFLEYPGIIRIGPGEPPSVPGEIGKGQALFATPLVLLGSHLGFLGR